MPPSSTEARSAIVIVIMLNQSRPVQREGNHRPVSHDPDAQGYRPNYQDLCRIWIAEEVAGWYAHIAESVEELREELRTMAADGRSPEEFGLKVRTHPATLIVTARNKMGAGERRTVRIGLALRNVQTTALSITDRKHNVDSGARLVERLDAAGLPLAAAQSVTGGLLLRDAPLETVRSFLEDFRNNSYSMLTDRRAVLDYIDGRLDEMQLWDVFIPQLKEIGDGGISPALGHELRLRSRAVDVLEGRVAFRKANFVEASDERAGLSDQQVDAAEEAYRLANPDPDGRYNYPALYYRRERTRPQLGLHLLSLRTSRSEDGELPSPWLAWNISFPGTDHLNQTTEYVVNAIWIADDAAGEDAEEMGFEDD